MTLRRIEVAPRDVVDIHVNGSHEYQIVGVEAPRRPYRERGEPCWVCGADTDKRAWYDPGSVAARRFWLCPTHKDRVFIEYVENRGVYLLIGPQGQIGTVPG